jgi:hypothetical protein
LLYGFIFICPLARQALNIQHKSDINRSDTEEEKTKKYENLALEIKNI